MLSGTDSSAIYISRMVCFLIEIISQGKANVNHLVGTII